MRTRKPLTKEELDRLIKEIEPFRQGLDLINDHVVVTDPHGTIIYANEGAELNTGFIKKEMLGKNPGDLWGGQMSNEFYDQMWKVIQENKLPWSGEVRNRHKDGTEYWQELHISPVLDDSREVRFYIGIEPNITRRKARETILEEKVEELERINRFFVNRELRISELKKELERLHQERTGG